MYDHIAIIIGHYLPMVCSGICSNLEEDQVRDYLDPIMKPLADAYLRILKRQEGKRKEFFGLRDFYRYACCHAASHMNVAFTMVLRCITPLIHTYMHVHSQVYMTLHVSAEMFY